MIEIEGLRKCFGEKVAVRDLTLRVPRGQLYCFLGPNGAGKTTTMKLACGLLHPDRGTVRIAGHLVGDDDRAVRRILGYIPDTPFLYERLTPVEFMDFTADLYALEARGAAGESRRLLDLFGLGEHRDVLVKDLSHGMRQRLAYASTFLHEPEVLLIDEPFIGLDPHSIRLIKDLLRAKARAGMTILLTTHILALAEDIADRLGIISRGELVAEGTLQELLRGSAHAARLEDVFLERTEDGGGAA